MNMTWCKVAAPAAALSMVLLGGQFRQFQQQDQRKGTPQVPRRALRPGRAQLCRSRSPTERAGRRQEPPGWKASKGRNRALSRKPPRKSGSQQHQSNSLENARLGASSAMRIYVYVSQQDLELIGFNLDEAGANLPDELGPWHQEELPRVVVVGVGDDPMTEAVRRDGYCIVTDRSIH